MRYDDLMSPQRYVSRRFYEAVKLSERSSAELSRAAGLGPSMLSHVLHHRRRVRVNDPRILKLAKLLNLKPSEIFEPLKAKGAA